MAGGHTALRRSPAGGLFLRRRRTPAGCQPHGRRVEVDVVGGARGTAGVAGELVLVGGPSAVGDLTLDACVHDHRELDCGAARMSSTLRSAWPV
jgi:hypothetical protein